MGHGRRLILVGQDAMYLARVQARVEEILDGRIAISISEQSPSPDSIGVTRGNVSG